MSCLERLISGVEPVAMTNWVHKWMVCVYINCGIAEEEKEDEIQIGLPTDVKHVAHIGWDGPAAESPTWVGITLPSLSHSHYITTLSQIKLNLFISCACR